MATLGIDKYLLYTYACMLYIYIIFYILFYVYIDMGKITIDLAFFQATEIP